MPANKLNEQFEVAAEIAAAAVLVRRDMAEDAECRAAAEALAVVLEKTAANFGHIPAGVATATLAFARALSVLDEDGSRNDAVPAAPTPRISQPMFDTIRRAEQFAKDHGDRGLSNALYGLGCTLGSMR